MSFTSRSFEIGCSSLAQASRRTEARHSLWTVALDVLFPRRCAGCRKLGTAWCAACQASLVWLHSSFCSTCGRPQSQAGACPLCRRARPGAIGVRSAVLFEGPVRQAIHAFKYEGQMALAPCLGRVLEACWASDPLPADVLVPVPLHPARLRERGYNQAALLARHLSAAVSIPVVEDCLVRTRATAAQLHLGAPERQANVAGAFRCVDGRLAGRRVVLVDDVCTTGATLEACGAALEACGAAACRGLTLARAVGDVSR